MYILDVVLWLLSKWMYLGQIWTPRWAADETVDEEHVSKPVEKQSCKISLAYFYWVLTCRDDTDYNLFLYEAKKLKAEQEASAHKEGDWFRPVSGEVYSTCAESMSQADVSCSARQRVFQEALRKGNTAELHSLLRGMTNCEFNVNSFGPEGQTALHQSVIDGNLELVKLLVKFGADVRLANRDGWSALHMAAFGGHQDIALYLITRAKYSSGALWGKQKQRNAGH